jgi:hypothetical protein
MNWKDVGKLVGKSAPVLGNLLGGSVGERVGDLVSSALGVNSEPDDVAKYIQDNPDAILKLKDIEFKHKEELYNLQITETNNELLDRQDARKREIEFIKSTGQTDKNVIGLTWITTIGFFGIIATLICISIPDSTSNILFVLLGTLAAKWGDIIAYFFGSSKGSKDKGEVIANAMSSNTTQNIVSETESEK